MPILPETVITHAIILNNSNRSEGVYFGLKMEVQVNEIGLFLLNVMPRTVTDLKDDIQLYFSVCMLRCMLVRGLVCLRIPFEMTAEGMDGIELPRR